MALRLVLYGMLGWCAEILWSAIYDLARRRPVDWSLRGHTYLWMFPIYGGGLVLLFEPAHDALRALPWPVRGLVYVPAFWAVEYVTGWMLRRATGRCPWDYSYARFHLHGLIRWDYAPLWFVFGLFVERLHDVALEVQPALERALGLALPA
jgi:uncharacterized membrane protein